MPRRVKPPNTILDIQEVRELRIEGRTIEATYGPNAYSDYLRRHGRRPDRETAAAIGRLLGGQVKASDDTMQPSLSGKDRKALNEIRTRRRMAARRYQQLINLQNAIALLAEIDDDPATLVGSGSCVLDTPAVVAQIDFALSYLKRFAEYWNGSAHPKDQNSTGFRYKRNGA